MEFDTKQDQPLYAGSVQLEAATGAGDAQGICPEGYHVAVTRRDGLPMSEMELRSLITNLSWALEGEVSHIDLDRTDRRS